jgi:hypothetical protein
MVDVNNKVFKVQSIMQTTSIGSFNRRNAGRASDCTVPAVTLAGYDCSMYDQDNLHHLSHNPQEIQLHGKVSNAIDVRPIGQQQAMLP